MALVVGNGVLVRLIWAVGGTPYAINVLGGRKVSATTIDQGFANTLGAAIKAAFTAASGLHTLVGTTITLQKVGVRDISSANRPEFLDAGASAAGTAVGDLLPPQIAMCVTLRTASAGKSFRGRQYITGFTETVNDATGKATSGVPTVCESYLNGVKAAMTSSGLAMAVISRQLALATDVTVVQCRDTTWDTIRKRAIAGV